MPAATTTARKRATTPRKRGADVSRTRTLARTSRTLIALPSRPAKPLTMEDVVWSHLPPNVPARKPAMGQVGSELVFVRTKLTNEHLATIKAHAVDMTIKLEENRPVADVIRLDCGTTRNARKLWTAFMKDDDEGMFGDDFTGVHFTDDTLGT